MWISPIANIMDLCLRIGSFGPFGQILALPTWFAALENPIVSEFVRCKMREDVPVVLAVPAMSASRLFLPFEPAFGAFDSANWTFFDRLAESNTDSQESGYLAVGVDPCVVPSLSHGLQFY